MLMLMLMSLSTSKERYITELDSEHIEHKLYNLKRTRTQPL